MKYLWVVLLTTAAFSCLAREAISQRTLVIDPGHGGPGADMTHNGGGHNQYRGAVGPVHGIAEQWVNLKVAEDLHCKTCIPWGYGTFTLGHEHILEPLRRLLKVYEDMRFRINVKIRPLKMGETYVVEN